MEITKPMYESVYRIGKSIVSKGGSLGKGAEQVQKETGMNLDSAKMYLNCVTALITDGDFGRTIKGEAFDFFLGQILADYGQDGLKKALSSFDRHKEKQKNPLLNLTKIAEKYRQLLRRGS